LYEGDESPALTVIMARTEERARSLAQRECLADPRAVAVELREGRTVLWRAQRSDCSAP
jgi:hypothetical protein